MPKGEMMRVPHTEAVQTMVEILEAKGGMAPERAALCARLFADASRDGVPSHGLNRFGLLMKWILAGAVMPNAELTRLGGMGGLERWDGNLGPGQWNAFKCMGRAMELAKEHGLGCVALRRTNHWMRAGNYGWQAAEAGYVGICWTNTIALMPAWGSESRKRKLGNSPLVMAMPRRNGEHVVLDMAMAQYSMGKLSLFKQAGVQSPLVAGFDMDGKETHDPAVILAGGASMPIGAWKGAGLAMMLDLFAATLAGGKATHEIKAQDHERGVSQMYLALNPAVLGSAEERERIVAGVVGDVTAEGGGYPGARSMAARRESAEKGIEVDEGVWKGIVAML